MDNSYVIINVSDLTEEMIENSDMDSIDTVRKSLDGSKAVLKFKGDTPECFSSYSIYSHSEILVELRKDTWYLEDN